MRLLLDTHVVIWSLYEPQNLSMDTARLLTRGDLTLQVSVASIWEAAIKRARGRLPQVSDSFPDDIRRAALEIVPVSEVQAWKVRELPAVHRDPFDRLLVALALVEAIPIVTRDETMADYGVDVIRA